MTETPAAELYERDFYAWTQEQAKRLRELRRHNALDTQHLAEEIEDLGVHARHALASHVRHVMQHLAYLAVSPADAPRQHWAGEVTNHRDEIRDLLETSPSLANKIDMAKAWRRALRSANEKLAWYEEPTLPTNTVCPLTLQDLASEELDVADLCERVRRAFEDSAD